MPDPLGDFIQSYQNLLVLTGAGCSVPSGIPVYRDQEGIWQRSEPITHQDFINQHASRQRYWARSMAGWPTVANAEPNAAHYHLAELERRGRISLLVTQNIDRLHQRAGHANVVDLHGRLDQVVCLNCGAVTTRGSMQKRLLHLNGHLPDLSQIAPDGDAELVMDIGSIDVPACLVCEGVLKPNVVFFGGAVERSIVQLIYDELSGVDGLLVVGSSLAVFSGFRFCRRAAELGKAMACINPGKTRGDGLFTVKIEGDCVVVLNQLMDSLV